jgi:hypothetical protein
MATTIKLKNGSGAPLAGDLVQGEPALDLTNKRLYTEDSGGTVIEVGTNPTSLTTGTFTSTGIDDNATSTAITIDSSENVGIGTNSPSRKLHVSSSQQTISLLQTSASAGQIDIQNATATSSIVTSGADLFFYVNSAERMRIDSSGNVGIGTTSPNSTAGWDTLLEVSGTLNAGIKLTETDTANGDYSLGVTAGTLRIWDETASAWRMTLDSSGNIGIGTASPTFTTGSGLEIQRTSATATLRLEYTGANGYELSAESGQVTYNSVSSLPHVFEIGSSEKMRITSSGNVGIGTASPSNLFVVAGATGKGALEVSTGLTGELQTLAYHRSDAAWLNHTTRAQNIIFKTDSAGATERMRIDSSGNVGIGTSSPVTPLHVYASSAGATTPLLSLQNNSATAGTAVEIRLAPTPYPDTRWSGIRATSTGAGNGTELLFLTNNTSTNPAERMRIDSSGNVGIGTASPAKTLDVTGTSRITGEATFGNDVLLTNDAYVYSSNGGSGVRAGWLLDGTNQAVRGYTAGSERMRIDSSGNLLVGATSVGLGTAGARISANAQANFITTDFGPPLYLGTAGAGTATMVQFYGSANTTPTDAGRITSASGGTPAFASASDIRLKDNVTDHESELTNILSLRPVRWDWKDNALGSGEGFIAQELEQTAWSDLVSEDEAGYKIVSGLGIVETRLIKAIQEQQAMIEELKAEVAALKGA